MSAGKRTRTRGGDGGAAATAAAAVAVAAGGRDNRDEGAAGGQGLRGSPNESASHFSSSASCSFHGEKVRLFREMRGSCIMHPF